MEVPSEKLQAEINALAWMNTAGEVLAKYPDLLSDMKECRRVPVLRMVAAYRLQEKAYGRCLKPETERYLDIVSGDPLAPIDNCSLPRKGTKIVRVWKGTEYRLKVLEHGHVEVNGIVYPSFSAAARAITGTRCNGRQFFGIKPKLTYEQPEREAD